MFPIEVHLVSILINCVFSIKELAVFFQGLGTCMCTTNSRSGLLFSTIVRFIKCKHISASRLVNNGCQGWFVQLGRTIISVASSLATFPSTLEIKTNGGKSYSKMPVQLTVNASMFSANGSGFHEKYPSNFVLSHDANISTFVLPKWVHIFWNTFIGNAHSVFGFRSLLGKSARFSTPGTWEICIQK